MRENPSRSAVSEILRSARLALVGFDLGSVAQKHYHKLPWRRTFAGSLLTAGFINPAASLAQSLSPDINVF